MSSLPPLREIMWCVPPYIGVLISTVVLNSVELEHAPRAYLWITGAFLILPFCSVQAAILLNKVPIQRGFVFGFVGPVLLWLVGNLVVGSFFAIK